MRVNPMGRALKNAVLKGAAGQGAAGALGRGVQAAGQVSATASEFLRVRRDPAEVARRRRKAAVRRSNIWGAGTAVGLAASAALTVSVVHGGLTATLVFSLILVAALVIWCALGLSRSISDLRRRSRAVAALPPPQPARRAVAGPIRAEIARLDSFSDGLRDLVGLLPVDLSSGSRSDTGFTGVSRDVVGAADEAERVLRRQAQEYTLLRKTSAGSPRAARPQLDEQAGALAGSIRDGVAQYGQLVAAATETVSASAQLNTALVDLQPATDRLRALAMGMREIAEHARPPQA